MRVVVHELRIACAMDSARIRCLVSELSVLRESVLNSAQSSEKTKQSLQITRFGK